MSEAKRSEAIADGQLLRDWPAKPDRRLAAATYSRYTEIEMAAALGTAHLLVNSCPGGRRPGCRRTSLSCTAEVILIDEFIRRLNLPNSAAELPIKCENIPRSSV